MSGYGRVFLPERFLDTPLPSDPTAALSRQLGRDSQVLYQRQIEDRVLREAAGFRMGPFELLDLTGLDVSSKVMESIYEQFQQEPRFRPSSLVPPRVWTLPDLDPTVPENWRAMVQMIRQQSAGERFLRSGRLDPQRRWVDPSGYRLSDRVWRQGRVVRRNIDSEIRAAIRRGDGPLTLASRLEHYLNPELAPVRFYADGRMVSQFTTSKPTGAGHGSVYARTLARTELMRIHHVATLEAARKTPGAIGLRWRLSGSHSHSDECDDKAHRSSRGMGRGEYTFDEFPRMPSHPNCICVSVPVMLPRADVVDLIVKQYGGV